MGHLTSYAYTDGSGTPVEYQSDLAAITSPDGQSTGAELQNLYDASGRVTSQRDPAGATTGWDYSAMDETTGSGSVVVTDPTGVPTTYHFVGFEFTGSLTAGQPATRQAVNWSSLTPLGSTDADGATTAETTDAAGDVTSVRNALGQSSSAWYDGDDEPICRASASADVESDVPAADYVPGNACEALFRAGLLPGSTTPPAEGSAIPPVSAFAPPPAYVTYSLYDDLGNLLWSETGGVFVKGDTVGEPTGVSATYHLYAHDTLTIGTAKASCTTAPPSPLLPCATVAPADSHSTSLRITRLAYDAAGDLASASVLGATGAAASTTTYRHDADGELTATVSPLGNASGAPAPDAALYTTSATYDAAGRPTELQSGLPGTVFGREELFSYDASGNETAATNPLFETTATAYDADDRPTLSTSPDHYSTLTCHDGDGRVFETVPPAGVAAGGLTATSCPAPPGNGETVSGQPSDATITQYSVTADGEAVQQTAPAPAGQTGGVVTTDLYDPAGLLAAMLSPTAALPSGEEAATAYSYDTAHRRIAVTAGLAYDPSAGSYATTAATTTSSTCYDPGGVVSGTVPGDGNTSLSVAAAAGLPVVSGFVCGPGGPASSPDETSYRFDALGDPVTTTRPVTSAAAATTTDSYFPDGSLDTTQSPQELTTTASYTAAGWLAGESYSGTGAGALVPETFSYDPAGERTSTSDASGTAGQLFDPFGELASATDGAGGTVSYGYDTAGRVAAVSYPLGSADRWAQSDTVEYGRDKAGLVTSLTDFSGDKITIAHDADGAPTAENLPTTAALTISTCYATTAGVTSDGLAAISLEPTADAATSCSSTADWTDGFTYADTAAGLVSSEADTPASTCSPIAYGYDAADRLASYAPGSCAGESPSFDASGNLTSLPGGATAAYQPGGELCWSATSAAGSGCSSAPSGATAYAYDGDGDLTDVSSPTTSIGWNGKDQLTSFSQGSVDMSGATYDATGLRTSDTFSGTTQQFSWDRVSGAVPRLLTDGTNAYLYLDGSTPVEQVALATGSRSYLLGDAIGSVRAVVSSTGAVLANTTYDPWGNPTSSLAAETPFAFAGGYRDPSGLEYLLSRYYEPILGQFLSLDPLVDETLQPYAYVNGDPVNATDPGGECGCAIAVLAAASILMLMDLAVFFLASTIAPLALGLDLFAGTLADEEAIAATEAEADAADALSQRLTVGSTLGAGGISAFAAVGTVACSA